MKMIIGLVETTRLFKAFFVGTILVLGSGSIEYGIGTLFFLMFSFVFNDWVDALKDSLGHPERAIPSGKITRRQALYFSAVLFVVGLGYAQFFLSEFFTMFVVIYGLSMVYSFLLKPSIPILATPVWSSAVAILLVQPFTKNTSVYVAVTLLVFAYEILLDYRDRVSDKVFCKTPTIANILGKNTVILAILIFCVSSLFLIHTYI